MCFREEMEYDVEGDLEPFRVLQEDDTAEVNRFAGDWITQHLFSSLFWLTGTTSISVFVFEEWRHEVG